MESAAGAQARGTVDLAIIGVMSDGGLRRSGSRGTDVGRRRLLGRRISPHQDPEGQEPAGAGEQWPSPRPPPAPCGTLSPPAATLSQPVFGLTGQTLANRVRAAARAAGLGEDFSGHSGRIGMARRMVAAGAPNAAVQHQGRWRHGDMVARYTRGEAAGEALKWLT